jgi:hypothetical protein
MYSTHSRSRIFYNRVVSNIWLYNVCNMIQDLSTGVIELCTTNLKAGILLSESLHHHITCGYYPCVQVTSAHRHSPRRDSLSLYCMHSTTLKQYPPAKAEANWRGGGRDEARRTTLPRGSASAAPDSPRGVWGPGGRRLELRRFPAKNIRAGTWVEARKGGLRRRN